MTVTTTPGKPDPKLKEVRAKIEALCLEYDIAAVVTLHNAPGNHELFHCLMPTYSILRNPEPGVWRVVSKLSEYQGNKELQLAHQEATANMLSGMADTLIFALRNISQLEHVVDQVTGAEHSPMVSTEPPKH